jgi:hypothetical protein
VLALTTAALAAAAFRLLWPPVAVLGTWGLVLVSVAIQAGGGPTHGFRTLVATALMQLSYGVGLLAGILRGPGPRRHLRAQS